MTTQATRTRKAKKEAAKAEEFIDEAYNGVEALDDEHTKADDERLAKRRTKGAWPCTAEDLVKERDHAGRSWAQVAVNLGLGSPGQARKAYSELVRPHHESQMSGKRARTAVAKNRRTESPGWNDDSAQEEIEARLNGEWIEETGSGSNFIPAHWSGSDIVVRRQSGSYVYEEEIQVKYVVEFTFGKNGDCPLGVTFICRYTGHFRTIQVQEIIQVR